jgi:hypothetical protein
MDLAHIHLLLNHWPVIGAFIGLGLFLISLIANSNDLKQASLALFVLLALLAIPTYMSGNVAQDVLRGTEGLSDEVIRTHEGAAMVALIFIEITGLVALVGLWQFSRQSGPLPAPVARWNSPVVLLLSIATVVCMSIAGNTGGAIHHPEIGQTTSLVGTIGASIVPAVSHFATGYSRWIWPLLETVHFLGLILIVAAIGGLNLRLLGFFKQLPVAPLHRLLPWGILGVAVNIVTGVFFFVGMPYFYVYNLTLYLKIGAMTLAGITLILFNCTSAFRAWASLGAGDDPPVFAKLIAASSLLLWLLVIVFGRYLPFTEGSLMP